MRSPVMVMKVEENTLTFTAAVATNSFQTVSRPAAMKPGRLPVMPTLIAAYRDWGRTLNAMRAINLSAIIIITAISVGAEFVPQRLWEQQLSGEALDLVQGAIWAFLLAPFVIALHRFDGDRVLRFYGARREC
jgi:hypothetical protein